MRFQDAKYAEKVKNMQDIKKMKESIFFKVLICEVIRDRIYVHATIKCKIS